MKLIISLLIVVSMNSFAKSLNDPQAWQGITDRVMGGKSDLVIAHRDGVFTMSGIVTTKNNGGFVRLSNRVDIDSNDFQGVKFQAKGNNESYEVHITLKGFKIPPWSYLSKAFEVTDEWREYRIAFKDLKTNGFNATSMKPKNIRDLSIAGYGRDFEVDLAIKNISLFSD
ncbi:CIA30 family protein [Gammaproteobacteria bacterium]|nr:CIA30 family protein [Gammaproteobacteria bacterium]